jgi:hypothetical protein
VIAYWFGRELGWPRRETSVAAGLLAGTAVLLVPAMLVRDDLKQYTADACMALLVLALTSRVERKWSRPGLLALSAAAWGGMLFSDASAFVGVAAFGAVCVVQLAQRAWRRLAEVAAVGAGTAVLMLGRGPGGPGPPIIGGIPGGCPPGASATQPVPHRGRESLAVLRRARAERLGNPYLVDDLGRHRKNGGPGPRAATAPASMSGY